ncbi:MAG TPA: HlyD family efflux transporter periplasmic adaptor subunit [Opitutaceae bacterium]|nr:HlyD family efflux transporter periplasmic adaptor subunit [Opitutaceae bacterium]
MVSGALLVALVVVGLWPRAVPVETARVTRGPLAVTVDEEGMTRVKNRYVVSAPVAGQLRRIDWKPGAVVEAGKTVLAVLETSGADFLDARSQAEAEARVHAGESNREMAAAQRERARAAHALARSDLERARALQKENTLSRQEFDVAMMKETTAAQDERAAEFGFQVAEFELEQARAVLTRGKTPGTGNAEPLVITSPVNGRILRVFQESSRVVPGGFALLEVGDPSDLEVRVEVLSRDGVAIRPGARVMLEQWGGPEPLEARVRLVEPSAFTKISALGVEEQRVYVVADFVDPFEKRPTLGDSYRVEARITIWEGQDCIRASAGALFQRAGAWQAFVVDGSRARLRTVKVGHTNGVQGEILGGLNEGDRVIVYPGDKVADGTRVTPLVVAGD